MAKEDSDALGRLLQEVFSAPDGAKRLLEHLLNQAMQAEASEHVGAGRHERTHDPSPLLVPSYVRESVDDSQAGPEGGA